MDSGTQIRSSGKIIFKALWHSLLLSLGLWVLESIISWLYFSDKSLIELFLKEIPPYELFIRLLFVEAIFIFGLVNARNLIKIEKSKKHLTDSNNKLNAINQQLRANEQQLKASNQQLLASEQQLRASNQQLRASESELEKKAHDLGERVKELNGLYSLSESIRVNQNIEVILQDAANLIPSSWHYPEITCSRLTYECKYFLSKNFEESEWVQSTPIFVNDKIQGKIEVFFKVNMPQLDEGPFMKEERDLIDALAKNLGRAIEKIDYQKNLELEKARHKLHEKQLKTLFNGIEEFMYLSDPDTYEIVYVNNATKKIFGEDIIGKKCYEVFQNKKEPCSFCTNDKILGENFGETYIWEHKNQSTNEWYRCADKGINWTDGRKLRLEIATNITPIVELNEKLLATNQQLKASEQQLKAINEELILKEKFQEDLKLRMQLANDSAGIGVWEYDLVDKKLVFDDWMYKLYGFPPNKSENAYEIWNKGIHPEDAAKLTDEMQECLEKNIAFNSEFRIVKPNGEVRYLKANANIITSDSGIPIKLIGANYDITQQKQSEKDLLEALENVEESETRFKALHNASFGGITIHDKGLILDCNLGLSEITGYTLDELIGMDGLLLIAEETRDMVMSNILAKYEKPYEAIGIRKNGEKYPLRLEARMIPYKGKEVRVVEFRDITEQKKAEQEIIEARKKAEESDELKSAFLANMSHEIRTPMNGILGFTSLLEEPDLTSDEKSQYIEIIKRSGMRMLNTVNDIIDISKIDAGQMELVISEVDICLELESIYQFFRLEAENKGLKLSYSKKNFNKNIIIRTDKNKFESILTNLIKNAIKYTDKGQIDILASLSQKDFILQVKDTGIGIPKDRINSIFNRFEQADIKDSRAKEGSGLGLAISKSYAEMMGGHLKVDSTINQGSVFTLKLPIS